MSEESWIKEQLQGADRAAGPPKLKRHCDGGAIEQLHLRRIRRNRLVSLTTAAALGVAALGIVQLMDRGVPIANNSSQQVAKDSEISAGSKPIPMDKSIAALSQKNPAEIQERLRQLEIELEIKTMVVAALVRKEQDTLELDESASRIELKINASIRMRTELEKAALIILQQANRRYDELNLKASAIEEYRQVIEYFPSTLGAREARERLAQIETNQEGVYYEKGDDDKDFVHVGSTNGSIT